MSAYGSFVTASVSSREMVRCCECDQREYGDVGVCVYGSCLSYGLLSWEVCCHARWCAVVNVIKMSMVMSVCVYESCLSYGLLSWEVCCHARWCAVVNVCNISMVVLVCVCISFLIVASALSCKMMHC